MNDSDFGFETIFEPDRQKGLLVYSGALIVLIALVVLSLIFLLRSTGGLFVFYLFLFLGALGGLPLVAYRLYGLLNSRYTISRDGLYLRWGLRQIQLPIQEIEWARTFESVGLELPAPRFFRSGILVGQSFSEELGIIEYLSTGLTDLLLVATRDRIYAISPRDISGFTRTLRQAIESGSLSPVAGYSAIPVSLLSQLWENRLIKMLMASGFVFNVGLFVVVNLVIPQQTQISIGFDPELNPSPLIPVASLRLLSLLSIIFGLIDFGIGIIFFRQENLRPISYMLWGMSGFLPLLLMIVISFF